MPNYLSFTASSNLKNLIGKDLVTDHITAVFELVKNSYDADAEVVQIEFTGLTTGQPSLKIGDNGIGMNLEDIKNKWMVIGTESKKDKEYSDKFKRPLNGEKGIGRFSVDRLGRKLELYTVKESSNNKISMYFDWLEFETKFQDLSKVQIPYIEEKVNNEQGVTLVIRELRDNWNQVAINKLMTSLRQLKSPFEVEDNFKITINVPEYNIHEKEIIPYNLGEISSLWIDAEIPIEDESKIKVKVVKDGIEYIEEYNNPYNFGPLKSTIYFFNKSDKIRFNNRMSIPVKDFGNIRLYRDDFRIYPYGDSLNDWLDLDVRKAQGHSRFFGSRDLIGHVQIYRKYNKGIHAPTNRQGIIQNEYSQQLRRFILEYPVKLLEKYFFSFKKAKNEIVQETKEEVSNAIIELKKVAKEIQSTSPNTARIIRQVTEVVQKGQIEQTKFIKDQEELIKVYQRVASKEVLLHRIIHEALINIDAAKSVSNSLIRFVNYNRDDLSTCFEEIVDKTKNIDLTISKSGSILLKARDNVIQKKEKSNIEIHLFVNELINEFSDKLNSEDINVELKFSEKITYYMDGRDLKTIIENFISNSIKSLVQTAGRKRIIWIKVTNTNRYLILNFKDNGIGIPEHLRNRIFDPFYSTTHSFGMGLSIVDEIIKEYNGELNLVENNESGAEFQIKFRR